MLISPLSRPGPAAAELHPLDIARELAVLGPRVSGSRSHAAAERRLGELMRAAGLRDVGPLASGSEAEWRSLGGTLPGGAVGAVLLAAHYDTVAGSPGALDNASGCGVVVSAAAELARSPRARPVRALLFDGEEATAAGSRQWLATLSAPQRRRLIAALVIDSVGGERRGPGVLHLVSSGGRSRRDLTPAWLVHAVLQSAAAAGLPLTVQDRRWSWFAQLGVRCASPRRVSDADSFAENAIPALVLSDSSLSSPGRHHHRASDRDELLDRERLERWRRVLSSAIRRLDRLPDLPQAETEYLVVAGRVWIRRDLLWTGFLLWILLVWRGRPGRWRGASAGERRLRGRTYLPGFAFRLSFLLSVFVIPSFSAILLYPAAVVALLAPRRGQRGRRLACALAALPAIAFVAWLTAGQVLGWLRLDLGAALPALLVGCTIATCCLWLIRSPAASPARPGVGVGRPGGDHRPRAG